MRYIASLFRYDFTPFCNKNSRFKIYIWLTYFKMFKRFY